MRFGLDFHKKNDRSPSVHALEAFLNEHTIGTNHGTTFECIFITFVENPSKSRKFKQRLLYGKYADIELPVEFHDSSKLLIDDFVRCFTLIPAAIQKSAQIKVANMDYDHDLLQANIERAADHLPCDQRALGQYYSNLAAIEKANHLKRVNCRLKTRRNTPRPLTKRLVGVRIYDKFDEGILGPHPGVFAEIFSNLLRRSGMMLPNYQEIYFSLAETVDEAKSEIALVDWHEYTYCALDPNKYKRATENEKRNMLLDSLSAGLRSLADVDHLDTGIVENVIDRIYSEGAGMELIYIERENSQYKAQIVYRPATTTRSGKILYQLRLTSKQTDQVGIVDVDSLNIIWAPYSLGTLSLTKKEVVIKARKSFRAQMSLKSDGLPNEYRFLIDDVFPDED